MARQHRFRASQYKYFDMEHLPLFVIERHDVFQQRGITQITSIKEVIFPLLLVGLSVVYKNDASNFHESGWGKLNYTFSDYFLLI